MIRSSAFALLGGLLAGSLGADEVWVAPTYQADFGGVGIGSNSIWPATVAGAVRFAWAVPDNLQAFQSAKVVLIPHSPGGAATLNVFTCRAENADAVTAACVGPLTESFTGVANELLEVDISAMVGPGVGARPAFAISRSLPSRRPPRPPITSLGCGSRIPPRASLPARTRSARARSSTTP